MKIESSLSVSNAKDLMESQRYLLYSILSALFLIFIVWLITGVHITCDSSGYATALNYLKTGNYEILEQQGQGIVINLSRLLRPLSVLLAFPFIYVVDARNAFGIENSIFIILSAVIMYLYSRYLLESEKLAFYSTFLFLTSFPVVCYGFGVMAEMGTYFFILLTIYLTIRFFKTNGSQKYATVAVIGFICGVGVLMKENVAAGLIFFILMLFFSKINIRKTASQFCILLSFFLLPVLVNQVIIWHYFDFTYYDWYVFNNYHYVPSLFTGNPLTEYPFGMGGAFGLLLLFSIFGIIWYARKNLQKNRGRLLILVNIFIASSVIILLWSGAGAAMRFLFIYFPIIIPMAAYAIGHISSTIKNKNVKYIGSTTVEFSLLGACIISTCLLYYIYVITHNYPPFQLINESFFALFI